MVVFCAVGAAALGEMVGCRSPRVSSGQSAGRVDSWWLSETEKEIVTICCVTISFLSTSYSTTFCCLFVQDMCITDLFFFFLRRWKMTETAAAAPLLLLLPRLPLPLQAAAAAAIEAAAAVAAVPFSLI